MKTFALAFLCALCALTVSAQPSNLAEVQTEIEGFTPKQTLTVKYDKFEEQTRFNARDGDSTLRSCTVVRRKGGELVYLITFTTTGKEWQWLGIKSVIIVADDQRFTLINGRGSNEVIRGASSIITLELITFTVTQEQFTNLFKSKVIEFKIGIREYKATPEISNYCLAIDSLAKKLKD